MPGADSPSMVTICFPTAEETSKTQECSGWPSMMTVQAPHTSIPQPYFVPVSPNTSRKTHNSGVFPSLTLAVRFCPLTFRVIKKFSPYVKMLCTKQYRVRE